MADDKTPRNQGPESGPPAGGNWMKALLIWAGILLALVLVVQMVNGGSSTARDSMRYSDFLTKVDDGQVRSVQIGKDVDRRQARRQYDLPHQSHPGSDADAAAAREGRRASTASPRQTTSLWMLLLYQSLPFLLILGIAFFVMRQMQKNAGSGAMGFGRSKAKLLTEKHGRVTFDDVAGIDEAREELQEIVEFLKDPTKFARLGGKIPKGALLVGSPGTGKTLLARAIAGEANVPFFTISGSDFVEMFVGVGASAASGTCSSRPRRTPPASSSSTRSTRSGAIAAPASATAMTSASRR